MYWSATMDCSFLLQAVRHILLGVSRAIKIGCSLVPTDIVLKAWVEGNVGGESGAVSSRELNCYLRVSVLYDG